MDKKLKASELRAVQYWFLDGLAEMSGGVMVSLLALYFAFIQLLPESKWGNLLLFVVVGMLAFGMRMLMLRIRQRTTYPHTGFVEPKNSWKDRKTMGIIIAFTLILMGLNLYLILTISDSAVWATAVGGLIFAFIFGLAGFETKLVRFIFLAAFCLLMGVGLAFSGLAGFWGAALLCLIIGIVLFAFGIVTRVAYLHQTSMSGKHADEH